MRPQSKLCHMYKQNTSKTMLRKPKQNIYANYSVGLRMSQLTVLSDTVFTNCKKSSLEADRAIF